LTQDNQQIFRLPPAVLRAYGEIIRQMAQTARTKEVVPSLLTLADRFNALADQQEERNLA
jgi:EAL domain-containing protein (putative c-di-GMP-specific phosphodiesterase class I)